MLAGLPAFCWAAIAWAVDDTEIGAGVSTPPTVGTAAAATDAVEPTPGQPWRFFKWRFMCVVRLSTLWHTGHWVVPLCIFMCLYIESRFQNDLPQSLHECDGCSMTTVCESKSDTNVHATSWPTRGTGPPFASLARPYDTRRTADLRQFVLECSSYEDIISRPITWHLSSRNFIRKIYVIFHSKSFFVYLIKIICKFAYLKICIK